MANKIIIIDCEKCRFRNHENIGPFCLFVREEKDKPYICVNFIENTKLKRLLKYKNNYIASQKSH